jgi:hypothetical protein
MVNAVETATIVAASLLAVIALFQLVLALGAPLGRMAWGGRHEGVLPTRLRIASGVTALLIYPLILVAVLDSAGLTGVDLLLGNTSAVMWMFCGLFALGVFSTWHRVPRQSVTGPPFP